MSNFLFVGLFQGHLHSDQLLSWFREYVFVRFSLFSDHLLSFLTRRRFFEVSVEEFMGIFVDFMDSSVSDIEGVVRCRFLVVCRLLLNAFCFRFGLCGGFTGSVKLVVSSGILFCGAIGEWLYLSRHDWHPHTHCAAKIRKYRGNADQIVIYALTFVFFPPPISCEHLLHVSNLILLSFSPLLTLFYGLHTPSGQSAVQFLFSFLILLNLICKSSLLFLRVLF